MTVFLCSVFSPKAEYLNNRLNYIEIMTNHPQSEPELLRAVNFAADKHRHQRRKQNQIEHAIHLSDHAKQIKMADRKLHRALDTGTFISDGRLLEGIRANARRPRSIAIGAQLGR